MAEQYEILVPSWIGITPAQVGDMIAQELAKPDAFALGIMDRASNRLQVAMIELLLAGLVPDDALAATLPHAWVFSTHFPSTYVDTDTYVALFRRAGFVSDFAEVAPPTDPITVYRGVPHARWEGARALAWTLDTNVAQYFAHRLDVLATSDQFRDGGYVIEPTVWQATAPPGSVLALFYEQNELEVVVDPGGLQDIEIIEQSDLTDPDNKG